VLGGAFLVLAALVALHTTQALDDWVRDYFRPGDAWGPAQRRADRVVEGLRPMVVAPVLFLAAVASSIGRRSWRPAGFALLVGGSAVVVTEATKLLLGRPDPHHETLAHSGSFPSGHTVTVLVALGGALLLLRATRWWQWLVVAALGGAMGLALLIEGAHWLTDVVGGVLVSTCVLVLASTSRLRSRQTDPRTSKGTSDETGSQEEPCGADGTAIDGIAAELQTGQS
jgi:membrane-associated phospholipid phosphatase